MGGLTDRFRIGIAEKSPSHLRWETDIRDAEPMPIAGDEGVD